MAISTAKPKSHQRYSMMMGSREAFASSAATSSWLTTEGGGGLSGAGGVTKGATMAIGSRRGWLNTLANVLGGSVFDTSATVAFSTSPDGAANATALTAASPTSSF